MSFISPIRDSNNEPVKNAFKKESTAGDIFRIDVREPGKKVYLGSVPASGGSVAFTLPWHYQVGQNQLVVYCFAYPGDDTKTTVIHPDSFWTPLSALFTPVVYYVEETSNTLTVHNNSSGLLYFIAAIPHTSTPGQFSSKVVVDNQGDLAGIEFLGDGNGIIFKTSPGGKRFLFRLDDDGNSASQEL